MQPQQTHHPIDPVPVFERITQGVLERGCCHISEALPSDLCQNLLMDALAGNDMDFKPAGIGRQDQHQINQFIRRDRIRWIDGNTLAQQHWLSWMDALRLHLNRHLLLGLFDFESHFSCYPAGAFYRKHVDAFRGEASRVLSTVLYLNPDWTTGDGGELVIYEADDGRDAPVELGRFVPGFGSLVVFLSEEFPHEVLPTRRERFSIAGWYRVNNSNELRVDPAR